MIGFRMSQIKVEQFAILCDTQPDGEIGFNTSLSFGFNPIKSEIIVTTKYELMQMDKKMVILELSCLFEIRKEDWDSLKNDNKITFQKDFLAHLAMHTVGTARGVLFSKTEGTVFNQYILPPINVASKILEDITINVSAE